MEHNPIVTILNPEEVKNLFEDWGEFTSVCYDTQSNNPQAIAKSCLESGHFSGGRWKYIVFQIQNCPRFVIDQLVRHEQGVVKNVQSFRRVNKENFSCAIPDLIKDDNELLADYWKHMRSTMKLYEKIQNHVYYSTHDLGTATEQARYVLPMATESAVNIAFTLEGFIHFCHLRLCVKTESRHRGLATEMRKAVLEILPELEDVLVAQCNYLMWCPEKNGCGLYLNKNQVQEKLNEDN